MAARFRAPSARARTPAHQASQRVVARIKVMVRRASDSDGFLSEVSHTSVVNAHGALLGLAMNVRPNELLAIKNWDSAEEKKSRVVLVGDDAAIQKDVAIEFVDPAPRFWHIDFPPADWNSLED